MDNEKQRNEYDSQKRAKAGTSAVLRVVVAAYVAFLGVRLIKGAESILFTVIGIVFILSAVGICFYTYRRWRIDSDASRIPPEEESTAEDEPTEENADSEE